MLADYRKDNYFLAEQGVRGKFQLKKQLILRIFSFYSTELLLKQFLFKQKLSMLEANHFEFVMKVMQGCCEHLFY